MLLGFKRMWAIPQSNGVAGEPILVEGKDGEGATVNAEISGLSADPVKVAGSDITYYISRKGVGDIEVALGILDLPEKASDGVFSEASCLPSLRPVFRRRHSLGFLKNRSKIMIVLITDFKSDLGSFHTGASQEFLRMLHPDVRQIFDECFSFFLGKKC